MISHHRILSSDHRKMDNCEEEIEIPDGKLGFVVRLTLAFLFPVFALFALSVVIGFVVLFAPHFSISAPISVPSHCKIVSTSVDLRSSKVCELGLLNYNAKYVFYPFDDSRFRCRYDYYWASVFEVEYEDYSSGQTIHALAEAPNEALPQNCRPNFGAVWLAKDKFKVNKTYDCSYMSGVSKVRLHHDGFFNCHASDPSTVEMLRRYLILSTKIIQSWFIQKRGKANYWRWDTVAGAVTGFLTSLITISFIRILHHMKSWLPKTYIARKVASVVNRVFLKRACFLLAYFSFVGWLTIQYGKRLGLSEIYKICNH